jgi:Tfp pilus assembly protein PilX
LLLRLRREERGAVAILTALAMIMLVGFIGLGVEVGLWYAERRAMQTAADSAAMGGAWVIFENQEDKSGDTLNPQITTAALTDSKTNGFDDATDDITVTINHPPTKGFSKNSSSVEAVIVKQRPTLFASFFLGDDVNVTARSVASLKVLKAPCILALAEHEEKALFFSGTADVNLQNCGINVNSDDEDGAMTAQGASVVGAVYADIVGGLTQSNNAELDISDITTGAKAFDDPYAALNVPTFDTVCDFNNIKVNPGKTHTFTPGTYCGGIDINGTGTFEPGDYFVKGAFSVGAQGIVTLGAGKYVIGGDFTIQGGGHVTSDKPNGVTIFMTKNPDTNAYGQLTINAGAVVDITAAKAGDYLGIAFFQDRNAPQINSGSPNKFNGGSTMKITGAIYFPKQLLSFSGGTAAQALCTRIIAYMISFSGTSGLGLGCGYDFGVTGIFPPVVVE